MIVCLCRRVSDKTIRAAIADGAATVDQVGETCRAGTGCGACRTDIADLIHEHRACADCPRARSKVVSPYLQLAIAGETA